MNALRIIVLSVVAAMVFGIVHDQVTARVCIEYFTIGHPPVFASESPTLLGLGWGIIATWWVGLLVGAPLAFAAIRGPRPRRSARSLIRPIAVLLAGMGVMSLIAGMIGFVVAGSVTDRGIKTTRGSPKEDHRGAAKQDHPGSAK